MKFGHIMGTVTVIAIVGGTIYAIKKHKDMQKLEGEEISLEEARDIVKKHQEKTVKVKPSSVHFEEEEYEEDEDLEEDELEIDAEEAYVPDYTREMYAKLRKDLEELDEDEPIEDDEDTDDNIGRFTEEDRKLRHEASSMEALKQFKRMELAELEYNDEIRETMIRLFDFPFKPLNDGDEMLRTQIIDYRVRFFGFGSRWAKEVTFADVILHYARSAQFNVDESVAYWVEYFLDFVDLYYQYAGPVMADTIEVLNKHKYYNSERQTYGLFGLTSQAMDSAIHTASRNFDNSVTYEIEFQEFLKSCL